MVFANANEQDNITQKLREIRDKTNKQSSTKTAEIEIEKSIKKHMSEGLTVEEAIEYEANTNRAKQLEAKMTKKLTNGKNPNQYTAANTNQHD